MLLSSPQTTSRFYAPRGFKPAVGCSRVEICSTPQFAANAKGGIRGAKAKGIRYQEKVVQLLEEQGYEGVPGMWFRFEKRGQVRYAQADWVGFDYLQGKITIAEIKLSRVPQAWWQLNRLYRPLVQAIFPKWNIALCEIADGVYSVAVPEEVPVIQKLDSAEAGKTSFMRVPYGHR